MENEAIMQGLLGSRQDGEVGTSSLSWRPSSVCPTLSSLFWIVCHMMSSMVVRAWR